MEQFNKAVNALKDPDVWKALSESEFQNQIEGIFDALERPTDPDTDINTPESRRAAKKLRKELRRANGRLSLLNMIKI